MSSKKDKEKAKENVKVLREENGFAKIKNGKLKEILKKKIGKIKFTDVRNDILGPLYIVCEFFDLEGELCTRGVSVRSLMDRFNKKKGKNKAFGRAVKALLTQSNDLLIRRCVDDVIISRSLKIRNEEEKKNFLKVLPYLESSVEKNGKIYYKVTSFIALETVANVINFKSEFRPEPVDEFMDFY